MAKVKQRGKKSKKNPPRGDGRDYLRKPLTSKGLRKETQAATRLKYRPLEKEVAGEIRASRQRGRESKAWWNQYLEEVNRGRAETDAAYAEAGNSASALMNQAASLDAASTQRLNQDESASAALRGAMPSTAPAQREAAMSAQRGAMLAADASTTAKLGANQRAYLLDKRRIGVGQSIAAGKEEQRREDSLRQKRQELRRERGDYATAKRAEIRGDERDYLVKRGAFNLENKELGLAGKKENRERGEGQKDDQLREWELEQEDKRIRNEGKGGGRTPSEENDIRDERRNAYNAARTLYNSAGRPAYTEQDWNLFIQRVAMEEGIGFTAARQAVNRLRQKIEGKKQRQGQGGVHR